VFAESDLSDGGIVVKQAMPIPGAPRGYVQTNKIATIARSFAHETDMLAIDASQSPAYIW